MKALRRLLWVEIEFSAVEENGDAVVLEGAEAACGRLDHLDLRVEALSDGIGDLVDGIAEQTGDVIEEHVGHFLQGTKAGGVRSPMPLIEEAAITHSGIK